MKYKLSKSFTTVTRFSKALALFMLIVFPIVGFYLGTQYQQTVGVAIQTPDQTANWIVYQNKTWGFQLKLPPTWGGYLSNDLNFTNNPLSQYTADVCLYFKRPSSIPACILQISVFSTAEWNKNVQKGGTQPKLIGQNNNYYFTSNKYDPACMQLDQFQCDRSKEINQILSTFKFTE